MRVDIWHMQLIAYAAQPCLSQRPAIRHLYYAGYEVGWIADTCGLEVAFVQDSLNRIP